jgi:hypothetical protein
MRRLVLTLAALAPLALAACGPDCDAFCKQWVDNCQFAKDKQQCLHGCGEVGGDNAAFIKCVIDHSCKDIENGHCRPSGRGF